MLDRIVSWAENNESIRGLILTGSRANSLDKIDFLSDYDIAVFGTGFEFIENNAWLINFEKRWICVHDKFDLVGYEIPTRLVIFKGTTKVDFSFHPMSVIDGITNSKELPDGFKNGFKILLDKDSILIKWAQPTGGGFLVNKPSQEEFDKNVNEFWFEIYHVAKYLTRNDLWAANFRNWAAKEALLEMMQWQQSAKCQWSLSPKPNGKDMKSWIDPKVLERLRPCFGTLEKGSMSIALEKTIQLYREVSNDTLLLLDFKNNADPDSIVSELVLKIKT